MHIIYMLFIFSWEFLIFSYQRFTKSSRHLWMLNIHITHTPNLVFHLKIPKEIGLAIFETLSPLLFVILCLLESSVVSSLYHREAFVPHVSTPQNKRRKVSVSLSQLTWALFHPGDMHYV
jgi:glucose-6-phosphate-specific signal transduction histidine kinase